MMAIISTKFSGVNWISSKIAKKVFVHLAKNGGGAREKEKSNPTKIWEFKHSSGIFKKGDIEGLKHIKRRASSRNNSSINSRKNSSNQNYDIDSGARVRPSSIQDPSTSSNSFGNFVPQIPGYWIPAEHGLRFRKLHESY